MPGRSRRCLSKGSSSKISVTARLPGTGNQLIRLMPAQAEASKTTSSETAKRSLSEWAGRLWNPHNDEHNRHQQVVIDRSDPQV